MTAATLASSSFQSFPKDEVDRLFFKHQDVPQPFRRPIPQYNGNFNQNYNPKLGHATYPGSEVGYDSYYSSPPHPGHFHHHHSHPPIYSGRTKHHKSQSGALSALTLLAFLFFLNLLQNCLREQMDAMNPTVMVMTAGAGREQLEKRVDLVDLQDDENTSEDLEAESSEIVSQRSHDGSNVSSITTPETTHFEQIVLTSYFTETPFKTKNAPRLEDTP